VRVVDLSTDVSGRFATKLLAMAGLDVLRPASPDDTVLGRYLDAHKRIVSDPEDDGRVRALVHDADVVFTSFDRGGPVGLAAHPALRSLPRKCVEVTTSSFGATGPRAAWRGGPLAEWAASGYLAITGWPDCAPLAGPEFLCGYVGGYTAAIAAEAALRDRRHTGTGRRVDVSTAEAMLNVHQSTFSRLAAGIVRVRTGRYTEVYPLVVRPCREGHVSIGVVTDAEFDRLALAIDRLDLVTDPRFQDPVARWEHCDALDTELDGYLHDHDAEAAADVLRAHGLAAAAVASAHDVLQNPQLAQRGYWDTIALDGTEARAPGNPVPSAVPLAGPQGAERPRVPSPLVSVRRADLPLTGVVVLDFTAFWAGPSATRFLADLGARVIWVERPNSRREPPGQGDSTEIVMHYFHLKMNRNKESVVVDLGTQEGRDIARRLATSADVLVENFRPGVMTALGLGAPELCAEHPALVYVSLSGFGHTGPWADRRSYGPTIEAASSIEARTGYPAGEPLRLGHTLPDGVGGLSGALAALRGLRERDERGGVGGWFDLSQLEAYLALSGEEVARASTSGAPLARVGNRSRTGAIQGVFPCAGDDAWIAIRLVDSTDVQRLAAVAALPDFLASALRIPRDDDAIERIIGRFTTEHDKHGLACQLQDAGLEAFPVLTPPELVADAQLHARGFFVDVPTDGRTITLPGSPLHEVVDVVGPAPRFGADTEAVLRLLDRTD
jgi:crotonobetainyl-CoA:carnitine CoA-transferase CaiB-like acyl-CoA transferase